MAPHEVSVVRAADSSQPFDRSWQHVEAVVESADEDDLPAVAPAAAAAEAAAQGAAGGLAWRAILPPYVYV
jgi:hypothetical protein